MSVMRISLVLYGAAMMFFVISDADREGVYDDMRWFVWEKNSSLGMNTGGSGAHLRQKSPPGILHTDEEASPRVPPCAPVKLPEARLI